MDDDNQLPVPLDRPEETRRHMVLNAGAAAGWWTWTLHNAAARRAAQRRYRVLLPSGLCRELLADEVLPWALGVADTLGRADVIAFRPGLIHPQEQ